MKFLDKARVGVWGWGFGGYVSAMILGSNKKVFKCGVAVSPITDWIYYSELFFYYPVLIIIIIVRRRRTRMMMFNML
jgi:cephalosporin-C deacetylase-like acetyl esterase